MLQEVYLERASVGNPVFPEVVHHLLKRWWTTLHLCGKGVERKAQVGVVAEHLWGECFSLLKSIPSADENQRDQSVLVLLREPLVVSRYARGSRTILSLALIPLCEPVQVPFRKRANARKPARSRFPKNISHRFAHMVGYIEALPLFRGQGVALALTGG